jgi:hypothetical protein
MLERFVSLIRTHVDAIEPVLIGHNEEKKDEQDRALGAYLKAPLRG